MNSDAYYFGDLEKENILVHVDPAVIKAMASFVFIDIAKDILVGVYMHYLYDEGKWKIYSENDELLLVSFYLLLFRSFIFKYMPRDI